jgi:hypothetical protein
MENFTLTQNSGFFSAVAIAEDSRQTIVATSTTERGAVELMERLQARAALIDPHSVGPTDMSTKGSAAHPQGGINAAVRELGISRYEAQRLPCPGVHPARQPPISAASYAPPPLSHRSEISDDL